MKRIALAAVVAIFALTGCTATDSGTAVDEPVETKAAAPAVVEETPEPSLAPAPSTPAAEEEPAEEGDVELSDDVMDDLFATVMRDQHPKAFSGVDDALLAELGRNVCGAIDTGTTIMEAVQIGMDAGYTPEVAGAIVGGAVTAFCPDHSDELDEFTDTFA